MNQPTSVADYLDQAEQSRLRALRQSDPFVAEVLAQVERIHGSDAFKRVHNHARDFLAFIVSKELLGQERRINEKSIAIRVFHEPTDYNPAAHTAKIRVAAGNLRDKLVEYYATEGRADPITITIPDFGYVPTIVDRRISIGIRRFENWNPRQEDGLLCAVACGELVHELAKTEIIQVAVMENRREPKRPFRYAVRCSLETINDILRLNVSVSDLQAGRIVSSDTFKARREDVLRMSRQVANFITTTLLPRTTIKPNDQARRRSPAREMDAKRYRRYLARR